MSRRPEAHLGYGVVVPSTHLALLGPVAKAYALNMSRAARGTYDAEALRHSELDRLWRNPALAPEEGFSVRGLLDDLGLLHGVALFDVLPDLNEFDSHDAAVVFRETLREQDWGYTTDFVLPTVPHDLDRLVKFLALFGHTLTDYLRWIFSVTNT